ncbi:hypothetical protein LSH36_1126g00042 [Paralvinella palmiformis]|uniref:Uncharacterized protein n=1 Tax=Paralvinella palmiformis TaxID=53620 RepID=A0AAD9MPL5_9ANNE|nr:hypothetical protein LSH36_1126g00042 [Paralvinella palmiformis]
MTEHAEPEEPSPLESKVIRQIEYYFGDINLPRDTFLLQEIKEDDGWVPLQTMTKFNRLSQLSTDIAVLAAAMRKSTSSLMEVSEDGLKIRRSPDHPVPTFDKDRFAEIKVRSVYAKGFPLDAALDNLIEFFERAGKAEQVQMRKNKEKAFKGSCFVVYASEESAKKFLEMEETAKFGDTELVRLMKGDYFKKKYDESKQKKIEAIKKKQEQRERFLEDKITEKRENLAERITKGAVLHISNIPEGVTFEELKALFQDHGKVAWAEFQKGDKEGNLRFEGEGSAKAALEKAREGNDGKIVLNNEEVQCRVLDGEEELNYWRRVFQSHKDRMEKKHRGRSNFYGKSHRKRQAGDGNKNEPESKVAKTDD